MWEIVDLCRIELVQKNKLDILQKHTLPPPALVFSNNASVWTEHATNVDFFLPLGFIK